MLPRKLIAANFKMNKTIGELRSYLDQLLLHDADFASVDVVLAPPMMGLSVVAEKIVHSHVFLSAQNTYHEQSWAYTGEVSLAMLRDVGCQFVIIGHSERRALFGETNELINKKVRAALSVGIRPILCIGETLRERELGLTQEILKTQIAEGLEGIENVHDVDVAYEPVWAIGTGKSATPEMIEEIHTMLRSLLSDDRTRLVYGGSVNDQNAAELGLIPHVNGFLVGSASLDPERFAKIIRLAIGDGQ